MPNELMFRPGVNTLARLDDPGSTTELKTINPDFIRWLGPPDKLPAGLTMDQVKAQNLLLSPPSPAYDSLFTDPNTNRKLTLPRWKINTGMVNGQAQRLVSMDPVVGQAAWTLTVHLVRDTPTPGGDALMGAPFVPVVPSVRIDYVHVKSSSYAFQQVVSDASGEGRVATLTINDIDTRNDIKWAMLNAESNCKLVVSYTFGIASPIPTEVQRSINYFPLMVHTAMGMGPGGAVMMRPIGVIRPLPEPVDDPIVRPPPNIIFHPTPTPVPTPRPTPVPTPTPTPTPVPAQPQFTQGTASPTLALPFIFDPVEPVFQNIGAGGTGGDPTAPSIYPLVFEGVSYPYIKVRTAPDTFFYLPDSFKLCRRTSAPFYPALSMTVSGETLDNATVTLTYVALPVKNPRRLDDAKKQLAVYGVTRDGQPLSTPNTQLLLSVPGSKPEDGPFPPRKGTVVDLAAGFQDTLTLTVQQFNDLVDSLFTDGGNYFQGFVAAHLDSSNEPHIKFSARANDLLALNVFSHARSLDAASGGVRVVLTNGTEAPLHVADLPAQLITGDGTAVDFRVVAMNPLPPCDLAAATADGQAPGSIEVVLAPGTGVAGADWDIAFDLSKVQVKAERESFIAAIADSSVAGHVSRTIHVRVPSQPFQAKPDKYLTALVVTFDGGQSVSLDSGSPTSGANYTGDAHLPVSLVGYLLRRTDEPTYQYKRKLIYSDGSQVVDTRWTQDSGTTLYVSLDPKPVT